MRKLTLGMIGVVLLGLVVAAIGLGRATPEPPAPKAFVPPPPIPDSIELPPAAGRTPSSLVLPHETPPERPPSHIPTGRTLVTGARYRDLMVRYAYPGPHAEARAAWATDDTDAQLWHARHESGRIQAIRELHQMINLNRLQQALTEVLLVATFGGLTETEAAVGPLVDRLRGLEADGAVPVERVREEACALVTVEGPRVTPAMERAVTRLEGTAAALCEDPLGLLPEELATSANAFVIPRSEAEGWP